MKVVVNVCYGGFSIPEEWQKAFPEYDYHDDIPRDDKRLAALVELLGYQCSCTRLSIVEIPDESTDWTIEEYDGKETVIYVLNGKLRWA